VSDLSNTVALVTGGNGGIGLGMAEALAAAGADIAVWGRSEAKNKAAAERLKASGRRVHAVVCDVSQEQQVVESFEETVATLGKVDACFANAGVNMPPRPFAELSLAEWQQTIAVNLDGVMLTLREAAKHMIARGEGGSLVAVSSIAAIDGAPGMLAYASSKSALLGLMRGLAVELARHRIRCNSLLPGWTATEMTGPQSEHHRFMDVLVKRTPVRRFAEPSDYADVAVFLAGKEPLFHTGDELVVDGGYTKF
jgi:NAD(P)-dependent dehydrogenase (short-subunit alcohol dehydrogenase family)